MFSFKMLSFIMYGDEKRADSFSTADPNQCWPSKVREDIEPKNVTSCLKHWCHALFLLHPSQVSSQCLAKRTTSSSGTSSERNFLPHRTLPKLQNDVRWFWVKTFPYWAHHKKSSCYLLILHFVVNTIAILEWQRSTCDSIEREGYFLLSHAGFTHSD